MSSILWITCADEAVRWMLMRTGVDLQREGFRALRDRLGLAGAVRFLWQMELGHGDYTRERGRILRGARVSDVMRGIRRRRGR